MSGNRRFFYYLAVVFSLVVTGCSSESSNSSSTPTSPGSSNVTLTGVVVDGYLGGATAFLDLNGNGTLDAGEPSALTDANGNYALTVTAAQAAVGAAVVVEVPTTAIDQDTGLAVGKRFVMSSPSGNHGVISPMTTMVKAKMDQDAGLSVSEAEDAVKTQIGLSGSTVNILSDYVAAAQSADPYATDYARVHNIARVSAQAVKDNLASVEAAAAGTGATLDDIIGIIVGRVVAELSNIALQVDLLPTTNFDPYAALSNTNVGVISTATIAADVTAFQQAAMTPVIRLNGPNQMVVLQGGTFVDPGAVANSNVDGDISARIIVGGTVNTNVAGNYVLTYDVRDAANRAAVQVLRVVTVATVADTVAPVITLNGLAAMTVNSGTFFTDPGAVSDDPYATVIVSGFVNAAIPGVYTLTYNATDGAGNQAATVTRTVTVADVTPPAVFVLNGASSISILVGTVFTDPYATAWDAKDGDISANVVVTGTVNTAVVGTYTLTYNVSDAAGNAAPTLTRTVIVAADVTPPVVTAPAAVTVEATGALNTPNLGTATAVDNVDGPLTPVATPTGPYTVGVHTITWIATDAAGNQGSATQILTITDTTAPVVTAPAAVTVEATATLTPVSLGAATAIDSVAGTLTATAAPAGPYAVGIHTITWSATDGTNTGTATQTVTVTDTTAPAITVLGVSPASVTQATAYTDAGATASDIVDGAVTVVTTGIVNTAVIGAYTLTYTATDTAGNSATATRTVNVVAAGPAADPMLILMNSGNALNWYETWVDIFNNQTGVYRTFSAGAALLNPNSTISNSVSSWNPVVAAFDAPLPMDNYTILLTTTGWQQVLDSSQTFVDDGAGGVLVTLAPGITETWNSTVTDVSGQNMQTAIAVNTPQGVGAGGWATAIDPAAVFSAGAQIFAATSQSNQDVYRIEQWDDGTGCPAFNGNCNISRYWDHVANFNGLPADVYTTVLSQNLSILGNTLPYNPALQLYKDIGMNTQGYSVALMAASTADTTGQVRIYASDFANNLYGAYDWSQPTVTERVPVATTTWNLVTLNGQQIIEFVIPAGIILDQWMQGVTKMVYSVQNGFVRIGSMTPAGANTGNNGPGWFSNDVAAADIKANFSRFTAVYDPAAGGGISYVRDPYTIETVSAANGMAETDTQYVYDSINSVWVGSPLAAGRWVLDATGANTGFQWLDFTANGINIYNLDATIDSSLGGVGFGHDVRHGVTIEDVRGARIADYVNPTVAAALINPNATFSNPGPGVNAPVCYSVSNRSIGDRYKINSQLPTGFTALSQLIGTNPWGLYGFQMSIGGVPTDTYGTATWTNGPLIYNSSWDMRTVNGAQMLYVVTPPQIMPSFQTDRVGTFAALIGGQVYGRGDHLADGIVNPMMYNIDSVASGNQSFNAAAIADIKAALGRP